jgi:ribonuclease T1
MTPPPSSLSKLLHRLLLAALLLLAAAPAFAADAPELRRFAQRMRLDDVDGFVATIAALRTEGHLPARYVSKQEAERLGWRPGQDLCRVAPGRVIGGDRFLNAERRLPATEGRSWREADLDPVCGRRGAKRLVFSDDGLQYVTTDHYRTFVPVPDEERR